MKRRSALHLFTSSGLLPLLSAAESSSIPIATNTYPWSTFAKREGGQLQLHTDELLTQISSTGITGYEPIVNRPEEFDGLKDRLDKHGLSMRSLYVNSVLHDKEKAAESMESVMAIAKEARGAGAEIIVTKTLSNWNNRSNGRKMPGKWRMESGRRTFYYSPHCGWKYNAALRSTSCDVEANQLRVNEIGIGK